MRTLPPPILTLQDIEQFWSRVTKGDGCWIRGRSNNPDNSTSYSSFTINGKNYRASAISLLISTGRYPSGIVCHSCDNPRCVRPDHLVEGTPKFNTQDMMAKGRGGQSKFERRRGPRSNDKVMKKSPMIASGIHLAAAEYERILNERAQDS